MDAETVRGKTRSDRDEGRVSMVTTSSPAATGEELTLMAEIFQILADPTRLNIVDALRRQELCVADLAAVVGSSESAVSHHLRQLRLSRLVRTRRDGRMIHYRLDDDHVATLIDIGLEHVREILD
jgi:DNA-binding transcriptional ArsR family regulator